jgi:prepilin-type N-terminal cleavage/methylation domain-containing protein
MAAGGLYNVIAFNYRLSIIGGLRWEVKMVFNAQMVKAGERRAEGGGACGMGDRCSAGFTLMELLVVVSVMAILLGITVPMFTSMNSPRKSAALEVKSALETARALALREGRDVYVAFTDDTPTDDDNCFNHFAMFLPDETDLNPNPEERRVVPASGWERLPDGIVFALGEAFEVPSGVPVNTVLEAPVRRSFPFSLEGGEQRLPFLMFNEEGRIQYPQFYDTHFHYLGVAEGRYRGGEGRVLTKMRPGVESGGEYPQADCLHVNLYSGRVRLITQ